MLLIRKLITTFAAAASIIVLAGSDARAQSLALTSAAAALLIEDGTIVRARLALGGVGTMPWRALEAEEILHGIPTNADVADLDVVFVGRERRSASMLRYDQKRCQPQEADKTRASRDYSSVRYGQNLTPTKRLTLFRFSPSFGHEALQMRDVAVSSDGNG